MTVVIAGAAETPYTRHPAPQQSTQAMLVEAIRAAIADAGLTRADVDGLAVSGFTLRPDHAVDVAVRCGLGLRWIMEDPHGGAGGVNMLQHAVRAVQCGDADTIVIAASDRMTGPAFHALATEYNSATRDLLTPLGVRGPNAAFALLTQRHREVYGLRAEDYGAVAVAQRRWAARNPGAVYRAPLSIEEYLAAPLVSDPLRRYDCVPIVSGADAIVVRRGDLPRNGPAARVLAVGGVVNAHGQGGDGLRTGLETIAGGVWDEAGVAPGDVHVVSVYDDYPVMTLIQLVELGLVPEDDPARASRRLREGEWPVNTSGGQLSAGQAGAAAGLHGLVEAVTQLRGRAGARQVEASLAVVSGYGMVAYRYGACAGMAVLEAV